MIPNSKNIILIVCSVLIILISYVLLFSDIVTAHKFNIYNYFENKKEVTLAEDNLDILKSEVKEMDTSLKGLKDEEEVVREQASEVNIKINELNSKYGEGIGLDIASLMMLLENSAKTLDISIAFDATRFTNMDMYVEGGIQTVTNTVDFSGRYVDVMEHIEYLENTDFISIENVFFVNSSFSGSEYPDDIEKRVDGQYTINVFYFGDGENMSMPGIPGGNGMPPDRGRPGGEPRDPTEPVTGNPPSGEPSSSKQEQYVGANGECLIKGNESSKIYHLPDGASYEKTDAEVMFCSEQEAIDAGYRVAER